MPPSEDQAQDISDRLDDGSDLGVLNAFLRAFVADVERGVARSVVEYQQRWPGHATRIAAEHARLVDGDQVALRSAPFVDVPSEEDGVRFGDYALLDLLASGGQGVVYRARHTAGDIVALKVLTGLTGRSGESWRRFRREAELASRLAHPGICVIREFGEHRGIPFLAMELIEGDSLAMRLAAREFPSPDRYGSAMRREDRAVDLDSILPIFRDIALALHHAHEAGVVHRDIKPSNVILRSDGTPVIVDFGIARAEATLGNTLTGTGDVLGTPAYMSPEQVDPSRGDIDRRSDIFSLGVTLYETIAGERPFRGPTWERIRESILRWDPEDLTAKHPHATRDLTLIVGMTLEKEPARRYATAMDLALDLERLMRNETVTARPPSAWVRIRRWTRRNPRVTRVGAATFVSLIVITVVSWVIMRQAEAALADTRRLADAATLIALRSSAEELWPPIPEHLPRYDAWLARADELVGAFALHEQELGALRTRGGRQVMPDTDDSVHARAVRDADRSRTFLRERLAALEDPSDPAEDATAPEASKLRENLHEVLTNQETPGGTRETWRFLDPQDQARHEVMAALVEDLRSFLDPDRHHGLLADVRDRRDFARSLEAQERGAPSPEWDVAIACIADETRCPLYRGLRITVQRGLVPLGLDPQSGLYEFMDLYTSDRSVPVSSPLRDGAGHVRPTEEQGIVFVLIPGRDGRRDARDTEGAVALDPFFIGKFELLRSQWARLTGQDPSMHPTNDEGPWPVDSVDWEEADRWLRRANLDLPTGEQWEHAARAGAGTPWYTGSERESLQGHANIAGSEFEQSHEESPIKHEAWNDGLQGPCAVGRFRPNRFGLHDVHGNLSEWVEDQVLWHELRPGDGKAVAVVLAIHPDRLQRGGSYRRDAIISRLTYRLRKAPRIRDYESGVRAARRLDR
ncbi:MAG: protein kinase [Planctomycetes bacterium]|nr:protein kinase [Planctomycetota bacterium]